MEKKGKKRKASILGVTVLDLKIGIEYKAKELQVPKLKFKDALRPNKFPEGRRSPRVHASIRRWRVGESLVSMPPVLKWVGEAHVSMPPVPMQGGRDPGFHAPRIKYCRI